MKTILMSIVAAATLLAGPALAQKLSVVGTWSSLPLYQKYEKPFWSEELSKLTGGDFTAKVTSFDQMGIKGGDVYRMLGSGVFDIGATVSDYTVGDAPALEGLDVPLVATTAKEAHAMVDAYRPEVAQIMRKKFNAQPLGIAPYPPQVLFCKGDVKSLADLKGKKVRGSGRMTTSLLNALGAEGVNIAFSEVPGALQRGVIDCAITGAGSGYSAHWYEVSDHLLTLPLGGWDPVVIAMNADKYDALSPAKQKELTQAVRKGIESPAWAAMEGGLANDVACLAGKGECSSGKPAHMTLVQPSAADMAMAKKVLTTVVLPQWAKRAGGDWAKRWNASVGKVVGVSAPVVN